MANEVIVYRPILDLPELEALIPSDENWLLVHWGDLTYRMNANLIRSYVQDDLNAINITLETNNERLESIESVIPNMITSPEQIEFKDLSFEASVLFGGWFSDVEHELGDNFAFLRVRIRQGYVNEVEALKTDLETGEPILFIDAKTVKVSYAPELGEPQLINLTTFSSGSILDLPATDPAHAEAYAGRLYLANDENNSLYVDVGGNWVNVNQLHTVGDGLLIDSDGDVAVKPYSTGTGEDIIPVIVNKHGVGVAYNPQQFAVNNGALYFVGTINGGTFVQTTSDA